MLRIIVRKTAHGAAAAHHLATDGPAEGGHTSMSASWTSMHKLEEERIRAICSLLGDGAHLVAMTPDSLLWGRALDPGPSPVLRGWSPGRARGLHGGRGRLGPGRGGGVPPDGGPGERSYYP